MVVTDVAVIIGGALAAVGAAVAVIGIRRAKSRRGESRARSAASSVYASAAHLGPRPRKVKDRKALWAQRYGAGGGWSAAAWTAGAGGVAGLSLTQNKDAATRREV